MGIRRIRAARNPVAATPHETVADSGDMAHPPMFMTTFAL